MPDQRFDVRSPCIQALGHLRHRIGAVVAGGHIGHTGNALVAKDERGDVRKPAHPAHARRARGPRIMETESNTGSLPHFLGTAVQVDEEAFADGREHACSATGLLPESKKQSNR